MLDSTRRESYDVADPTALNERLTNALPPSVFQGAATLRRALLAEALTSALTGEPVEQYPILNAAKHGANAHLTRVPGKRGPETATIWGVLAQTVVFILEGDADNDDTAIFRNPHFFLARTAASQGPSLDTLKRFINALGVCAYATYLDCGFELQQVEVGGETRYQMVSTRHDGVTHTYLFPVNPPLDGGAAYVRLDLRTGEFFVA